MYAEKKLTIRVRECPLITMSNNSDFEKDYIVIGILIFPPFSGTNCGTTADIPLRVRCDQDLQWIRSQCQNPHHVHPHGFHLFRVDSGARSAH